MSRKASMLMRIRETLGRAVRETGQALDRLGIQGEMLATTKRVVGDDPVRFQDHLSRHRQLMPLLRRGKPIVSPDVAFIAPCASLIGSVQVGAGSSIFYKAVLRADNCENAKSFELAEGEMDEAWELEADRLGSHQDLASGGGIFLGENSNVQDGCLISSSMDHARIGNGVTIGHLARIDSATVGDNCLIGMGSVLLPGVRVGDESFVAAGAVVSKDTQIASGELWVGNPARKLRDLTAEERQRLHYQSSEYVKVASTHSGVMDLGGNLPLSLLEYLEPPSPSASGEDEDEGSERDRTMEKQP